MKLAGIKYIFLIVTLLSLGLKAQSPYDVVKQDYRPEVKLVHDFGEILQPSERHALENKLVAYNDSTSVQIVVVTFNSLEGYPINLLASEIGEKWGVGDKELHNGIVIVLSKNDNKVTLRGGYGIQAKMPVVIEQSIIDQEMIPSFRQGNFYQGLDLAIDAIQLQLAGQYQAKSNNQDTADGFIVFVIIMLVILMIVLSSNGGDNGSSGTRRGRWRNVIITNTGSSPWSGGSFGGGFGGSGGFGGFGGGSFGGGGATGSW